MTRLEAAQKERNMEMFRNIVALYYVLKAGSMSLRVKQAVYRADEVQAQPIDFLIDVELKSLRMLGGPIYQIFLRAVYNENLELLPECTREALGKMWMENGLGPEGSYKKLYFQVKNEQMRSFIRKVEDDRTREQYFRANDEPF